MNNSFWTENRTIVALAVSILALAEIVDLTIVSVALPHIMGALNANINEVSLTMTSYIVAAAVFIPLTGIVSKKFGMKTVILASTIVFGIASILCGMSTNLPEMVIFRLLQGVGGAFLPSLAQAYIVENFSHEEQPKIMTVYSMCLVLGPVIGPLFGGYLVEHLSWRWIFYVNVPVCILGFVLILILMEKNHAEDVKTDFISFIFMVVGVSCLEYFLDEGNQNNWFESREMIIVLATGALGAIFFIWRGLLGKSVVDFRLFKDLNFNLSCLLVFGFMVIAVMALAYFPTLLQQGYGYPVDLAGYITAPRGLCAFLAAPIFIALGKKIDPRALILVGLLIFGFSNYLLTKFSDSTSKSLILITVTLQGVGLTGTFVMLMQCAFSTLPNNLSGDASGIFNFFRNIGSSVGTSIAATLIAHQQQASWHDQISNITQSAAGFKHFFSGASMIHQSLAVKAQISGGLINAQSFLVANIDTVWAGFLGTGLILWIPFVLKKPKAGTQTPMMH
ncbi:MAG: transporter [Burkholderiales bacterium]|jgi:DHA2 family multidrug resistance protein|nr:transporter [Burkholderiales bacterium]